MGVENCSILLGCRIMMDVTFKQELIEGDRKGNKNHPGD